MKFFILSLIKIYQLVLSPLQALSPGPVGCRFFPSCSEYSLQAIEKRGAFKGVCMSIKRLGRCGPWSVGGWDPV